MRCSRPPEVSRTYRPTTSSTTPLAGANGPPQLDQAGDQPPGPHHVLPSLDDLPAAICLDQREEVVPARRGVAAHELAPGAACRAQRDQWRRRVVQSHGAAVVVHDDVAAVGVQQPDGEVGEPADVSVLRVGGDGVGPLVQPAAVGHDGSRPITPAIPSRSGLQGSRASSSAASCPVTTRSTAPLARRPRTVCRPRYIAGRSGTETKGMSRSSSSRKCTASEVSSTTPSEVGTVTMLWPGVCPPTSVTTTPGATSQEPENGREI